MENKIEVILHYVLSISIGIGMFFLLLNNTERKAEVSRKELTKQIEDSIKQKVIDNTDKDLVAVVTYSDIGGWTTFMFLDRGTGIPEVDDYKITVQVNGGYKVGDKFILIKEE